LAVDWPMLRACADDSRGLLPAAVAVVTAELALRVRVMAAATLLVAVTCLVTGVVGATLLRGYLLGSSDAQLRGFAHVAARIADRAHLPPPPRARRRQALPAQFLVELIAADGRTRLLGPPVRTATVPRLSTAQLHELGGPFTVPAADGAGSSWRILVQRLPGGEHVVVAYSLADLDNTVGRECPAALPTSLPTP